ncbi:MAG: hypothetical protein JW719_07065, partial [Pirellulales bacterium]|nr:hypothetical protein [Pirellulales bacterium]
KSQISNLKFLVSMRRHAVGLIAVLLLSGAVALWVWPPGERGWPGLEAALWRVGAVMAVLWLAYPDLRRWPGWLLAAAPAALVIVAIKPRRFVYLIPLLLAIAVLQKFRKPKSKR